MEKLVEQALLYDFYGELLTEHQRKLYQEVIFDDLSLSEAAEEENISRQGVHDLIRRCDKALREYESKLGLVAKFQNTKVLTGQMRKISEECRRTGDVSRLEELEQLIDRLESESESPAGQGESTYGI